MFVKFSGVHLTRILCRVEKDVPFCLRTHRLEMKVGGREGERDRKEGQEGGRMKRAEERWGEER